MTYEQKNLIDNLKIEFFSLGSLPLVNNLTETFEESINSKRYPLDLILDTETGIVSLKDPVDSNLLFYKYLYLSGTSLPFLNHCRSMFSYLGNFINLESDDVIVDIGGNDGTLLKSFKTETKIKLHLFNIDPSDVIFYSGDGINIINSYFNYDSVLKVGKKAKIITTTNVFQHLVEINSFVENISLLLDDDGIWCLEFPYWLESMKTLQFDQIYHEHVYYYNVKPLFNLFDNYDLKIINISDHKIHGGSLRLLVTKRKSIFSVDDSVSTYLNYESEINKEFYEEWGQKVSEYSNFCRSEILKLCENNHIVAFGAAAKGCVFLNYLGLDHKHISYVVDDTKLKQNKYVPGTGLKIYDREKLLDKKPDFILILAHNFKDYIIKSLRDWGYIGKFIVFLPKFEIID